MAQRPKPQIRQAILAAAAQAFSEVGFERATLGDIAAQAGTSVGNVYKYFANKEELFAEFMPLSFPVELESRIRGQVDALRLEVNAFALEANHPYRRASKELLEFSLAHRAQILFLLRRAEGTPHASFTGQLVRTLVALAVRHARDTYPSIVLTSALKRTLTRTYRAFIGTVASILDEERSERAFRDATAMFAIYHLSGLMALLLAASKGAPPERAVS